MQKQPAPVPLPAIGLDFAAALAVSLLRSSGILAVTWFPHIVALFWVVPLGAFLLWYRRTPAYREWIAHPRRIQRVVRVQTWRMGGVLFFILYLFSLLPAVFAIPAAIGDVLAGALAPFAARWLSDPARRGWFLGWSWFGLLDFAVVIPLVVLASPSGALAGPLTTEVMTTFPLLLIPTFLVPLWIVYHVAALDHVSASQ